MATIDKNTRVNKLTLTFQNLVEAAPWRVTFRVWAIFARVNPDINIQYQETDNTAEVVIQGRFRPYMVARRLNNFKEKNCFDIPPDKINFNIDLLQIEPQ